MDTSYGRFNENTLKLRKDKMTFMASEFQGINPFHSGYLLTGILANSEDPEEMSHNTAFHQGLHCMKRYKPIFMAKMQNLEISTCDTLKYKMGNTILILSTCMGISNRMKRINIHNFS